MLVAASMASPRRTAEYGDTLALLAPLSLRRNLCAHHRSHTSASSYPSSIDCVVVAAPNAGSNPIANNIGGSSL